MQELIKTTSDLSGVIADILTVLTDSISVVVTEISTELANFSKIIGFAISVSVVDLIDEIFELYSYEWIIARQFIQELDSWINNLIYDKLIDINTIINNFTVFTDTLIQTFAEQLTLIDNSITPEYNERMFAIYGRIGEFSVAINAPPAYLEGAIQNARVFAMSVACFTGLSYYQFQLNWNAGVEELLIVITNSLELYRQNPQRIKVDIEESLIRPIFELEISSRRKEKEQIGYLGEIVIELRDLINNHKIQIDENKQTIDNLYELQIQPVLEEITDSFDNWKKDVYDKRIKLINDSFLSLFLQVVGAISEARKVLGLLDYGGDLLLRIDRLSGGLRIEQENKIADVTTRSFNRLASEWVTTVRESIG